MWKVCPPRLKPSAALVGLLFAMVLVPTARSEEPKLSISGYDPVAYFTDGKPVQGKTEFEYLWHKLRWRFASGAHRDLFAEIRTVTRRNTMAIVRWAWRRGEAAQGHGRSRGLGDRRRQALSHSYASSDGDGARTPPKNQKGRRELGSRQGSSRAGDRRAAVCRLPALDVVAVRGGGQGRRRRPGGARRATAISSARATCGRRSSRSARMSRSA